MLDKGRVALLPGTNFGEFGQGYARLTYATGIENIKEGIRRIEKGVMSL
jgi:aminotransferase